MNTQQQQPFDVAIIGAGLGGLLCGVILAKQGLRICIVEKNKQLGGALQTFAFHKKVFDSCVHYIGGLGEGHTLQRILNYAGVMDHLSIKPLGKNAFDKIYFGNRNEGYPLAVGAQNFIDQLLPYFPNEKKALEKYLQTIHHFTSKFPLFHLRDGAADEKNEVLQDELFTVLRKITANEKLIAVLAGNALLYAGEANKTPFYLHALVESSYIHSAHKILPGSSVLSKQLHRQLLAYNATIIKDDAVKSLVGTENIEALITCGGVTIKAKNFISNLHPAHLQSLLASKNITPAYHKRVQSIKQTPSCFLINVALKEKTLAYKDYNIYWHAHESEVGCKPADSKAFKQHFAIFHTESAKHPGFTDTLSIMFYGCVAEVEKWNKTYRTTSNNIARGEDYQQYKNELAVEVLQHVAQYFPEYENAVAYIDIATPLTFRDYLNTPEGSLYGIAKDVHKTMQTTISVRTKIPNLYLTGQNVNMHGVLGVAVTALATCGEIIGLENLLLQLQQQK